MTSIEREGLTALRNLLLRQHKFLMDVEKLSYEQTHGTIPSSSQLLNLLISHDHFAWLRDISTLVAKIDETLDSKKPLPDEAASTLIIEIKRLLIAKEEGEGFGKRYFDAMQASPDAIVAHGEMIRLLRSF